MTVSHDELIARYMREVGRDDPQFLHRANNLFVTKEGVIYYDREGHGRAAWGRRRRNAGPARNLFLGRFVGRRYKGGCMLLNGDGFDDDQATEWQTRLRQAAHTEFGQERCPIVPYMALDAAEIDYDTVKVIEVTAERNDTRVNEGYPDYWGDLFPRNIRYPENENLISWDNANRHLTETLDFRREAGSRGSNPCRWMGTWRGHRLQISLSLYGGNQYQQHFVNLWAQPENGAPAWQRMERYTRRDLPVARDGTYQYGHRWTERIHRLGASVFYGHGPDGRRHRWVSAFDMNEPTPLYFLAQLPDKGVCKSYEDALHLLAPDIVHVSREAGRNVFRQGDVFSIETSLDDEAIYKDAVTRVRRDIAMQNSEALLRAGMTLTPAAEGEVMGEGNCPFCVGPHIVPNSQEARDALMIHRTGHTADEVVVKANGSTFVRGRMFHDPVLEDATRLTGDHQPLSLGDWTGDLSDCKWYLAVRNTVPRQRPRQVEADAADTRQGVDGIAQNRRNAERAAARAA